MFGIDRKFYFILFFLTDFVSSIKKKCTKIIKCSAMNSKFAWKTIEFEENKIERMRKVPQSNFITRQTNFNVNNQRLPL